MTKRIYVGNLPFSATEDEVSQLFGQHGTVHSVALISDRETGRPRGFGFVEVDDEALQNAIQALDASDLIGTDKDTDLALLKLKPEDAERAFPYAALADSELTWRALRSTCSGWRSATRAASSRHPASRA